MTTVTSAGQLPDALATADDIEVDGTVSGMPAITLRPGTRLRGGTLRFGAKGIRLTSDNQLEDVTVIVPDTEIAIGTSTGDLGHLALRNVNTRGQVLLAAGRGHAEVEGLTIASADLRGRGGATARVRRGRAARRVHLVGQVSRGRRLTATLAGISVGTADAPVRGSGVFVAGPARVGLLRTGPVCTDGGIEPGTPDLISGGVYILAGAHVQTVSGPVTTHGANDMALGNWGTVGSWTARAAVTTHGPSGIGYVSFGTLDRLHVQAPVTTHGAGARGMNPADAKHIAPGQDRSLLPLTIGMEVSGVVSAAGGGTDFSVGDEVVTRTSSGYATAVTVPASGVYRKPVPLTFTEAANLLLAGTTAADLLHTSRAASGETILLHGAAGAVGVSVLQQARLLGVRVIGTASRANFPFVERFGGVPAEYGPGLPGRVLSAAPEGVAAALDTAGSGEAGDVSLALVKDRSRVVTIADAPRARADGYVSSARRTRPAPRSANAPPPGSSRWQSAAILWSRWRRPSRLTTPPPRSRC